MDPYNGYRRLAIAVLLQGARDARDGRRGARRWLRSSTAAWWAELCDFTPWPPEELN